MAVALTQRDNAKHQSDNALPELRHLNRDDFIRYSYGVSGLGEARRSLAVYRIMRLLPEASAEYT